MKLKFFFKIIIILFAVTILVGFILLKVRLMKDNEVIVKEHENDIVKEEVKEEDKELENVFVDIKGAVINPGVYEIQGDKKVIDVINLAGGFTENADTSMINLAKQVKKEMVIIIYTKEEVKKAVEPNQIIKYVDKKCVCPEIKNDACINNGSSKISDKTSSNNELDGDEKVNINTATLEDLQKLSGIGESKAKAIISYREENGEFKSIEEIKNVSGIGDSAYEKIKDYITI